MLPQVHQVRLTPNEANGKAFTDFVLRKEITPGDLTLTSGSGTYYFPIPEGITVVNVRTAVTEAYSSGSSAVMQVGVSGSAAGFLATTETVITTKGTCAQSVVKAQAFTNGRYFSAADAILCAFTGVTGDAGKVVVEVQCSGYAAGQPRGTTGYNI